MLAHDFLLIVEEAKKHLEQANIMCDLRQIFASCRKNRIGLQAQCNCKGQVNLYATASGGTSRNLGEKENFGDTQKRPALFSGDLSYLSIWQVLQMLAAEKKTGCLAVKSSIESKIFVDEGYVIHCESKNYYGEEAFFEVLQCTEGKFTFGVSLVQPNETINAPIEILLLEAAKLMDEQER